MRLLQRSFDVKTRFGGNFVQEIDGVSGGRADGRRVDWFYYVNGDRGVRRAPASASSHPATACGGTTTTGRPRCASRRWSARSRSRSESGSDGKKLPIRLVCMGDARAARATRSRQRLQRRRRAQRSRARTSSHSPGEVLRILVGALARRAQGHRRAAARGGPGGLRRVRASRPPSGGGDRAARRRRQAGSARSARAPGWSRRRAIADQQPTWLITGTDDVGVAAAAAALTEDQLRNHFALAIEAGRGVPLPLEAP